MPCLRVPGADVRLRSVAAVPVSLALRRGGVRGRVTRHCTGPRASESCLGWTSGVILCRVRSSASPSAVEFPAVIPLQARTNSTIQTGSMRNALNIGAALAVAIALLAGCAPSRVAVQPETTQITSYQLGQVQEGNTGDSIVRVARAFSRPTFSPLREVTPPEAGIAGQMPVLEPGQEWEAVYRYTDDGSYALQHSNIPEDIALHILPDGTVGEGWLSLRSAILPEQNQKKWPRSSPLFKRVTGNLQQGSFQAELVYSGKSNDVVKLIYREYLDGIARPAFTQELEYDLKESNEIRFKSILVEVLEATNSGIRFKVVDDGGLTWLPKA